VEYVERVEVSQAPAQQFNGNSMSMVASFRLKTCALYISMYVRTKSRSTAKLNKEFNYDHGVLSKANFFYTR